jgi:hypothetical protein
MTAAGHDAAVEKAFRLGYQAAVGEKVEGGYFAPRHKAFEDMAVLGAYVPLAALATTPPREDSGEVARLREALERLLAATNLRALRGRDHVPSMREEQDARSLARAALEPGAK